MSDNRMLELLKNLENLETLKKGLEKQINEIKEEIYPQLENVESIENNLYLVRYTLCEKVSLDTKRLEKEHEDIFKEYRKATLYRRFSYQLK